MVHRLAALIQLQNLLHSSTLSYPVDLPLLRMFHVLESLRSEQYLSQIIASDIFDKSDDLPPTNAPTASETQVKLTPDQKRGILALNRLAGELDTHRTSVRFFDTSKLRFTFAPDSRDQEGTLQVNVSSNRPLTCLRRRLHVIQAKIHEQPTLELDDLSTLRIGLLARVDGLLGQLDDLQRKEWWMRYAQILQAERGSLQVIVPCELTLMPHIRSLTPTAL